MPYSLDMLKRTKKVYELPEMFAAVRRMIVGGKKWNGKGGIAGRVSEDIDSLAELIALQETIDSATRSAVTALKADGYSWAEIAGRIGCSRQACQQRYGK